jgi:hypothetical protein
MKEFFNQLGFAVSYIIFLALIVLVCSFIPIVNIIVWIASPFIVLLYPFFHAILYKVYKLEEQEREEKALIKQYKYQKDLKEARTYFG